MFVFILIRTNRPIVYSCSWPAYQVGTATPPNYQVLTNHLLSTNLPHSYRFSIMFFVFIKKRIAKYCNLWRNYDDIQDSYDSFHSISDWFASQQSNLSCK